MKVAICILLSAAYSLFDHSSYGDFLESNQFQHHFVSEPKLPFFQFEQLLDHTASNSSRWNQSYFVDDRYFKPGGPVFLSLTGEWSLTTKGHDSSLELDLAKKHHGIVVGLEHRFYAENTTLSSNFSTSNFSYLTVEQAIFDAAAFIKSSPLNGTTTKTRWIAVGGSYAGNLAAWLRLEFPNLVYAAHSSSAPILAQTDFWKYSYAVKHGIEASKVNTTCATEWTRAVHLIDDLVDKTNGSHIVNLVGAYPEMDFRDILGISAVFDSSVQYGRPSKLVKELCNGTVFPALFKNASDAELIDGYVDYIKFRKPTKESFKEWDTMQYAKKPDQSIYWTWQYCKQFGFFQTSTFGHVSESYMYSKYVDNTYLQWACNTVFGDGLKPPTSATINRKFRGLEISRYVDRIVFVNGEVDPWKYLGLTPGNPLDDAASANPVIIVKGGHHCSDLQVPSSNSSTGSQVAYAQIVSEWAKILANPSTEYPPLEENEPLPSKSTAASSTLVAEPAPDRASHLMPGGYPARSGQYSRA